MACRRSNSRGGEAPHQLVAKLGVVAHHLAEPVGVELDEGGATQRRGREMPAIRREQPRPAEDGVVREHVDRHLAAAGVFHAQPDLAAAQQEEPIGRFSLVKEHVAGGHGAGMRVGGEGSDRGFW